MVLGSVRWKKGGVMLWFLTSTTLLTLFTQLVNSDGSSEAGVGRVIELSDKFLNVRHEGVWLIEFYAPWCGHCKKLEPIFGHVAQALHDFPIWVGKLDCTRFPSIAQEYNVRGYPTILLIKGDEVHPYRGDRTAEEMVGFAKMMLGPPIHTILDKGSFQSILQSQGVVFGYSGHPDGELWDGFRETAVAFQAKNYFVVLEESGLEVMAKEEDSPGSGVFVKKEEGGLKWFSISQTHENLTDALMDWVKKERFPSFPKVSRSNFQDLLASGQLLVLGVGDEDENGRVSEDVEEFKSMLHSLVGEERMEGVQFGWSGQPGLVNSVGMMSVCIPSLFILNTSSHYYYIPPPSDSSTPSSLSAFIHQVIQGQLIPSGGGKSIWTSFYRSAYNGKTAVIEMWSGNPILTCFVFALPIAFLAFILYSICCLPEGEEEGEEPLQDSDQPPLSTPSHPKTD